MTVYGYARVSTQEQDTGGQVAALSAVCDVVVEETASGGKADRPQLQALLDRLEAGDVLVVYKLDRFSRSLRDLLVFLDRLEAKGAGFRCLTQAVDTTSAAGRMMLAMLGAVAEFERELIRERTRTGLVAARAVGRVGGRPPALKREQKALARRLLAEGQGQKAVALQLGVSRSTIQRLVREER